MTIQKLYVDRNIVDSPEVITITRRLGLPHEIVSDPQTVYDRVSKDDDPVNKGKTALFLTHNRGAFIKDCPGTRSYTCCGYQILHIGTFCHMDCTYCILQSYFHPPMLQYFVNHNDLFKELEAIFATNKIHRLGTGEFTDSLIWELWTDLSKRLVPAFAAQNSAVLELKTKTTAIDRLATLAHNRKTIMAWSVNTPPDHCRRRTTNSILIGQAEGSGQMRIMGIPAGVPLRSNHHL